MHYLYLCRRVPKNIEIFPIGSRMCLPPNGTRIGPKCEITSQEIPDREIVAQWDVTMIMASLDRYFDPWLYQRINVTDQFHFWLESVDYYTWDMLRAFGVFQTRTEDLEFAYGWTKPGWPTARKIIKIPHCKTTGTGGVWQTAP
jgi:hypothetical protein